MDYSIAKVKDKIRLFEKTGKEMATAFLTPAEVSEVMVYLRKYEYTISGGYEEAERRIIVVGNNNADLNDYLSVIRCESSYSELNHRSVLGSVLGLGIKREMIGDIVVKNKICDIIIIRDMKEFILNNLRKIGRENVRTDVVDIKELLINDLPKKEKTLSIASLRVDSVVSESFGISRDNSSSLVSQEKVLLNFLPCLDKSKSLKEMDIISVRGYGRVKIIEVLRRNQKRKVKN